MRPEFVPLPVGHFLELPQQSALLWGRVVLSGGPGGVSGRPPPPWPALTLRPAAQLSAEVLVLLPQPPQLQLGLLRRHLQLRARAFRLQPPATPRAAEGGAVTHRVGGGPHGGLFQELQRAHHQRHESRRRLGPEAARQLLQLGAQGPR